VKGRQMKDLAGAGGGDGFEARSKALIGNRLRASELAEKLP